MPTAWPGSPPPLPEYVMSWSEFEYSVADGQPLTLYEFRLGDSLFWRYSNADKDIDFAGQVWEAQAISNSGLSSGSGDGMDITVPASNAVALLFRATPPSRTVRVRVMRWHATDTSGEFRVVWIGEISSVKREQIESCKLITISWPARLHGSGSGSPGDVSARMRCTIITAVLIRSGSRSAVWWSPPSMAPPLPRTCLLVLPATGSPVVTLSSTATAIPSDAACGHRTVTRCICLAVQQACRSVSPSRCIRAATARLPPATANSPTI